jgi:membrane protease YdiL (CAAX protease family)
VKWFEKHPARDLPLTRLAPDTAKGLCIGFAFFVVVVLLMYAFGAYRIGSFGTDQPYEIFEAFLMFLMVAVCEEIIFRGILFRWIDEKWGFAAALAVSSLFFGLVHISQPGATLWSSIAIAIEAGLLLGAAYKYAGSLWLPIGIHWAWNFTEGNIFGFSVSGGDGGASLITPVLSGSDLLTGGIFGAEASLIAPILGVMLSVWFIILSLPGLKSRI